jgi:hypothetical protein
MPRAKHLGVAGVAALLAGCATSVGVASPTSAPTTAPTSAPTTAATATPAEDDTCVGRNAQDLDVPQPVAGFGLAWNETDDDARLAFLTEIWADEGTYVVPGMSERIVGLDAMDDHIRNFQVSRPGEYFEWRGWHSSNLHHDRVLMPWRLCSSSGTTLLEGTDVGLIGPDGRLVDTTGFHPPG